MSYINRPYGVEYCESEREIIRERPYGGGYSAGYGVSEYGDRRVHQHQNGLGNVITEVVSEVIPGSGHHHHHNHSRPVEYIERRDERIVDSAYDPYRRIY